MKKIISFFDKYILSLSVILILILIPLYPKFPFIRIPDTYISIRLEDFLIAFLSLIFTVQIARRKVSVPKNYVMAFAIYWGIVFISLCLGVYVFNTIEFPRIGFLHASRRIQYMIPFFISFAAVSKLLRDKTEILPSISRFTTTISWVVVTIMLYALGQKSSPAFQSTRDFFENISNTAPTPIVKNVAYFFFRFFDFPAVQTMNAEFAKGFLLNLTPESRVSSTFAGHYDLAAYIVLTLPIFASLIFLNRSRILNWVAYVLSILTLVLTASRASFGSFVLSLGLYFIYTRKWKMLVITILLTGGMMFLNRDMTDRLKDMFQKKRVFQNVQTGTLIIDQDATSLELPAGSQFISEGDSTDVKLNKEDIDNLKAQLVNKELEEAKRGGIAMTQEEAKRLVDEKYNALQSFVAKDVIAGDTSLATRTQVEWPRAINAFIKYPLFGSGVSSLTESTDGDWFRLIGEIGIFGSFAFIYILISITKTVYAVAMKHSEFKILGLGFVASVIAITSNGLLIDVFEASKVAFTFWTVAGIYIAISEHLRHSHS